MKWIGYDYQRLKGFAHTACAFETVHVLSICVKVRHLHVNQARFKHMQSNANEERLIHHNMHAKCCRVNDVKRSQSR